nr:MAG TPA_asm: hypothetical protein [Caudoviricetes sp.]
MANGFRKTITIQICNSGKVIITRLFFGISA